MNRLVFFFLFFASFLPPTWAASSWTPVEKILGRTGVREGEMFKVAFIREDLNLTVRGIPMEPSLALTSWIVFKPLPKGTLVLGELILVDQEVPKVLTQLARNGMEVTALNNPLVNETPNIKSLQFRAQGSRTGLAEALKQVLYATGIPVILATKAPLADGVKRAPEITPSPNPGTPSPQAGPEDAVLDSAWSEVEEILGKGEIDGRVLQFTFSRPETITEEGVELPPFMGTATTFRFQRNENKIATTGSFVLIREEVNPVVETLTRNHFVVTGIHNHLLNETPRLFFLHFWAVGEPSEVARGLKEALDKASFIQ